MLKNLFKKKKTNSDKISTCDITKADLERMKLRKEKIAEHISTTTQTETVDLKTKAKQLGFNRKAKAILLDGTEKEYPYYWAEGHDGKIFLTAALEDGTDKLTVLDMKTEVKSLIL